MKVEGQVRVALPRARAFAGLSEAAVLRACTPGLTRIEETAPGHFEATLELKLPAVSGRFEGTLDVVESEPPARLRMRLRGKGAPGFVDGHADVALADAEGGATLVRYSADVTVGGQVARLGQRMLSGVAKELAGQFFETFEKAAAGPAPARAAGGAGATPGASAAPAADLAPPSQLFAGLQLAWRLLLRALGLSKRP